MYITSSRRLEDILCPLGSLHTASIFHTGPCPILLCINSTILLNMHTLYRLFIDRHNTLQINISLIIATVAPIALKPAVIKLPQFAVCFGKPCINFAFWL